MISGASSKQTIDWKELSRTAPARAGDLAYKRFCDPLLSDRRDPDQTHLVSRSRRHLRHARHEVVQTCEGPVSTYTLEPLINKVTPVPGSKAADGWRQEQTKTVVLIHGWTSEASFMAAVAETLRRAGFRVVLFDLPAHGLSPGTKTNIIACARVLIDVIEHCGPVEYAVAHSMGGYAALLAARGGRPYKKAAPLKGYVFISMPNDFQVVTRQFTDSLGLGPAARRHYERHLERVAHKDLSTLTSANYLGLLGCPALLIHCEDDDEIPVTHAHEVVTACPNADLKTVKGLGHRKILYASNVTREAARFLKDLAASDQPAPRPRIGRAAPDRISAELQVLPAV